MGFPSVPKLETLNDVERCYGRYFLLLCLNWWLGGQTTSNCLKIDPYFVSRNVGQRI